MIPGLPESKSNKSQSDFLFFYKSSLASFRSFPKNKKAHFGALFDLTAGSEGGKSNLFLEDLQNIIDFQEYIKQSKIVTN